MASKRFTLCDVTVDITGDSPLAGNITHTLQSACFADKLGSGTACHVPPDLTLLTDQPLDRMSAHTSERSRRFPYQFHTWATADGVRFQLATFRKQPLYTVDLQGFPLRDTHWTATASLSELTWPSFVPTPLFRALTGEHANWNEFQTAVALNEVLEPLIWTRMLDQQKTVIHAAAAVSPDGHGVAFTGVGNVGKTSIALGLAGNHGWRYIGDDRVVIGPGVLQRVPRGVRLAPHHLAIFSEKPDVSGMRVAQQSVRTRRRIPVTSVIDRANIVDVASFDTLVTLRATPRSTSLRRFNISRDAMIANTTAAIINEFWEFLGFMTAAAAISPGAPASAWHDRVAAIVAASLPETVLAIDIPIGADLRDVGAFVAATVD